MINLNLLFSSIQLGTVADWIAAVATLAAFALAVGAYQSWKTQHRSKAEEKLAHTILKTVYRLQDMLEDAKSEGFSPLDVDAWHEKYREHSSELRSLVHESTIYWGRQLRDVAEEFWLARCEVMLALRHFKHDHETNNTDALFSSEDHEILWGEAHSKKIRKIVRDFESALKDKHIK